MRSPSSPYRVRSVRGPDFSSGITIPPLRACAPHPSRSFSRSVTDRPAAASTRAADSPAYPAPITTTSASRSGGPPSAAGASTCSIHNTRSTTPTGTDSPTLRTVIGVTGMQHVALEVGDLDAAREFYVDVMGMTVLDRPDFGFPGMWLGLPDGRAVHLIEGHKPPHTGHHFALEVDDMAGAVSTLRDRGIQVPDPFETAPGAGLQAFINDPSGNVIELNQPHR